MEEAQTQVQPQEVGSKKPFNKGAIVVLTVLLLLGGGVYFASSHKSATPTAAKQNAVEGMATVAPTMTLAPSGTASAEKEFTVVGENYSFSPNQLTVKKGDKVKITFSDEGGFHNLAIDGYNEKTATIRTGNSAVVEFTADKAGSFAFYCSVGNHREQGMQGTLIVTE